MTRKITHSHYKFISDKRLRYIDGMRGAAILAVVFFHYFSRWTPPNNPENLYPYGSLFSAYAAWGKYGVQLFFVISGFVISMTLFSCKGFREFFVRRFARLFPVMLLSSCLTFIIISLIGAPPSFKVKISYFLPSLTFVDPLLLNGLFGIHSIRSMDGAYWSIFVEIHFYIIAAIVFFLNKLFFARNFLLTMIACTFLQCILLALHQTKLSIFWQNISIVSHLPWFSIGMGFYFLQVGKRDKYSDLLIVSGIILLLFDYALAQNIGGCLASVIIPALFFSVIRYPVMQKMMSARWVSLIGLCSYSLYLLHQKIGVSLIHSLGTAHPIWISESLASVVTALMIGLSVAIYFFYEHPANQKINDLLK